MIVIYLLDRGQLSTGIVEWCASLNVARILLKLEFDLFLGKIWYIEKLRLFHNFDLFEMYY